jgi:ferrochelatase
MAAGCDYVEQLHEAASLVVGAAGLATGRYDLAFQSRSGPPHVPWLEPDINDHLAAVHRSGGRDVIVVPIGFVSDHVEVLFDLDIQATATAGELGLAITRVPTVGTHPSFVTMVRQLVEERLDDRPRLHLRSAGPRPDDCPAGHCPRPTGRRPPPPRPATPGQRRDRSVSERCLSRTHNTRDVGSAEADGGAGSRADVAPTVMGDREASRLRDRTRPADGEARLP